MKIHPQSQMLADPLKDGLNHRELTWLAQIVRFFLNLCERFAMPWHRWPLWTGVSVVRLLCRRVLLEHTNLMEVPLPENTELAQRVAIQPLIPDDQRLLYRTGDGYGNDGSNPGAGVSGHPLGRNMAIVPEHLRHSAADPSPQLVAQRLLARRPNPNTTDPSGFIPAGMQLNVLSAAWIQANIHDWLDHMVDTDSTLDFNQGAATGCPLKAFKLHPTKNAASTNTKAKGDIGDKGTASDTGYLNAAAGCPLKALKLPPTENAASTNTQGTGGNDKGNVPDTVYLNPRTAWWDASFLYGQSERAALKSRTRVGGRLHVSEDGVPVGLDGAPLVGDQVNSWVGITLLQDLFAREHNAVAAAIAADKPYLSDEGIFRKARLVTSAVVAKIHTIDWTVELLKHPTLKVGMNGNWKGLLNLGAKGLGLVGKKKAENHGVPYNLTEEFTAIYRMHQMLPDSLPLEGEAPVAMTELLTEKGRSYIKANGPSKLWQSLVRYPCGAMELFNFPESLRNLVAETADENGDPLQLSPVDLAAVDVYRDRERGIPRYNEFRHWLDMAPITSWRELTGGDEYAMAALHEVYGDDINQCDLLVGNLAEKKIPGFAISETAFMIFLIMASRRLEADRFFTEHFTEDVYSKVGLKWVSDTNGMRDVLARHYPAIEKEIPPNSSAFTPYIAMPSCSEAAGWHPDVDVMLSPEGKGKLGDAHASYIPAVRSARGLQNSIHLNAEKRRSQCDSGEKVAWVA